MLPLEEISSSINTTAQTISNSHQQNQSVLKISIKEVTTSMKNFNLIDANIHSNSNSTITDIKMNETTIHNTIHINSNITENPLAVYEAACYEKWNNTPPLYSNETVYCPRTWDSWLCWPDTLAGQTAYELCPGFITGFDPTRYAHKYCDADGEWFRHPLTNRTWSNYTTCVDVDEMEWKQKINLIYEAGYCISLIAILLSLGILAYFRSLKCARITLHMNLFTTFAGNNSLWLMWYRIVVTDPETLKESGTGCVMLHLVLHYFLLTNYACMLCEGFYLHTVLVSAFISEQKLVRWLIAFGWTSPAIVIFIYGLARGLSSNSMDKIHCWMSPDVPQTNILVVPVCTSMLLNLVFLCNIVRVLLLKLRAPAGPQSNGPSNTVLQAFRATLLLVPLLGLQYILTPFRPEPGHSLEKLYEVVSAFTASFQGLMVAILFCFCNGEVVAQVKRKYRNMFFSNRPRSNSYTATQVSFVRCGPPLPGEEKV